MSDRRRQREPVTLAGVMTAAFVCALLVGGAGMLWWAGRPAFTPLAAPAVPIASPVVIVQPPVVPAVLVKMAAAYVARATETAPTPTWTPTPYVPPTAQPWTFCIKGAVKNGEMCEWPQPTLPPPTPYPACGTPVSGEKCIWRES